MHETYGHRILHEWRDSRDHFAERRYLARRAVKETHRRRRNEDTDDFSGEDVTEEMILDHLEEITDRFSMRKAASHEATIECVSYAEDAGLYNVENGVVAPCTQMGDESQPHGTHLVTDTYL
ncbi:hypothetical protein B0H13DRAFT_1863688 [Mycena leptocephala]|nr:hypothetical protein B0H13DRAFT_1863688 [Mycena leptocephala]